MRYVLLLLLLPQHNDGTTNNFPKKRTTDESFSINIGAGYGIGFDPNRHTLPDSTTQVNSTNFFPGILKTEAVIIGQPSTENGNLLKVDVDKVKTQSVPFRKEPNKKGVMDFNELQQIIHNVDDNSEYSKIVQVVKVPAVYEIHLEKVSQNQNVKTTKNPKQYIHQINNLINSRPKKKVLNKNPNNYKKDFINIDDWRAERDKTNEQKLPNPLNVFQPYNGRPVHKNSVNKNVRKKKNPNIMPNFHPFNQPIVNSHTDIYSAPQSNVFNYQSPEKPIYSTLTHTVPYNIRRQYQHRSETIPNDLVYGTQKEKVLNPGEINITMQPGTTFVTLPKLESENHRNFIEDEMPKPICQKKFGDVENVYFTTVRPIGRRFGDPDRSFGLRRSDPGPMKYVLYINKIYHDDW